MRGRKGRKDTVSLFKDGDLGTSSLILKKFDYAVVEVKTGNGLTRVEVREAMLDDKDRNRIRTIGGFSQVYIGKQLTEQLGIGKYLIDEDESGEYCLVFWNEDKIE